MTYKFLSGISGKYRPWKYMNYSLVRASSPKTFKLLFGDKYFRPIWTFFCLLPVNGRLPSACLHATHTHLSIPMKYAWYPLSPSITMWLTIIMKCCIMELLCEAIHHSWYYHICSDDLHSSDIEAVVFGYVYVNFPKHKIWSYSQTNIIW